MSGERYWPHAATATVFCIVVAGACTGEDVSERDAGGAAGESAAGGTAGGPSAGGTAGQGGVTATGGTGGSQGAAGGDPSCTELISCDDVADGTMLVPTASIEASTLTVQLDRASSFGSTAYEYWDGTPTVTVDPELGVLESVTDEGSVVTLTITLASGTAGGTIALSGVVTCWTAYCDVARVFTVTIGDGGEPAIASSPASTPALGGRLPVRLSLIGQYDTTAVVALEGAGSDAVITFDATDGVIAPDGAQATWTLPARPGLYQIEALVRRGSSVGTQALVVEVRPKTA